ncbi:DUF397 domain-containing protein [Streptomyces aurantiacus]|uniref:Uncharacterized protein n=1 Tax=Streptomyces aurantiacus JA 4570 TaxID=1286094 RepID=S3ZMY4_9ACTN|nr:DUF397 domain-containing protein [Streptomyces aurantiacus]EPH39745.1 hypothetical protein STRAU_7170 [Streptomyces aurantiacus JA 4570]
MSGSTALERFKSSYSSGEGGACLEVGPAAWAAFLALPQRPRA